MTLAVAGLAPLFVGPVGFLLTTVLVVALLLLVARVVFGIATKLVLIAAVVLGLRWLLGALGAGPPALG